MAEDVTYDTLEEAYAAIAEFDRRTGRPEKDEEGRLDLDAYRTWAAGLSKDDARFERRRRQFELQWNMRGMLVQWYALGQHFGVTVNHNCPGSDSCQTCAAVVR
jgi:hypothetical protein